MNHPNKIYSVSIEDLDSLNSKPPKGSRQNRGVIGCTEQELKQVAQIRNRTDWKVQTITQGDTCPIRELR